MNIKDFFTKTTAAAVLSASVTGLSAAPAEAQVRQVEPQSCRLLDRENQRMAREEDRRRNQTSRDVGRVIRNDTRNGRGLDLGRLGGAILGGVAEREVGRAFADRSYIRQLESRCAADLQNLEEGICITNQRETGTIRTRNGQMVGDAEGQVNQTRQCTSQSVGQGRSILTPR